MSTKATKMGPEGQYTSDTKDMNLVTAGGKICCLRCTALSRRTKQQCKKPALKASRTQKCGHHGGRPQPRVKHGFETLAARSERSQEAAMLSALEDAMTVLGMSSSPRTRGRKASGYMPVKTLADAVMLMKRSER